jgi:hypothetical protein
MSDVQQSKLISEWYILQDPASDPPLPRIGPYADQNTAITEGVAQVTADPDWMAFSVQQTWRQVMA